MGKHQFKFYHGTSSIFTDSIMENGLGGKNPNTDFNLLAIFRFLVKIAEENLHEDSDYKKLSYISNAIANQVSLEIRNPQTHRMEKMNFKHDGIYIALSMMRAIVYASLNKYGSEILSRSIEIYNLLKKKKIEFQIPEKLNQFQFEKYIGKVHKSIIVEIENIDDLNLEKEDGKTAKEALDFIRKELPSWSEKTKYEFFQYCNFKLLKPVHPRNLTFYELEFEGHPSDQENFEWYLTKIE